MFRLYFLFSLSSVWTHLGSRYQLEDHVSRDTKALTLPLQSLLLFMFRFWVNGLPGWQRPRHWWENDGCIHNPASISNFAADHENFELTATAS
jgi:hypothetical protein